MWNFIVSSACADDVHEKLALHFLKIHLNVSYISSSVSADEPVHHGDANATARQCRCITYSRAYYFHCFRTSNGKYVFTIAYFVISALFPLKFDAKQLHHQIRKYANYLAQIQGRKLKFFTLWKQVIPYNLSNRLQVIPLQTSITRTAAKQHLFVSSFLLIPVFSKR